MQNKLTRDSLISWSISDSEYITRHFSRDSSCIHPQALGVCTLTQTHTHSRHFTQDGIEPNPSHIQAIQNQGTLRPITTVRLKKQRLNDQINAVNLCPKNQKTITADLGCHIMTFQSFCPRFVLLTHLGILELFLPLGRIKSSNWSTFVREPQGS